MNRNENIDYAVLVMNGSDSSITTLDEMLNDGWEILRTDSTNSSIAYVLNRQKKV
jgi:hypothetical protein